MVCALLYQFCMSQAARFTFSHEGTVLARFALDYGEYIIGSDDSCQVVIDIEGMKPSHARLSVGAEGVRVEDLESGDGTFIAGTRLTAPARLTGNAPVTFGSCGGELRMDSSAPLPARKLRKRSKRKPRRLAPEDPGWEVWAQPAPVIAREPAPEPAAVPVTSELQGKLDEQEQELTRLREENAVLAEADRKTKAAAQENLSLLKVANRALLKKLSKATAPTDENETLRRELKQREKALVEAWAGRQAADERNSRLAGEIERLETGRAETPLSPLLYLPTWLFWSLLIAVLGAGVLGYLLKTSTERARRAEAIVAKVRATAPQFEQDARALVKEGGFQQALAKIDSAIALDPSRPEYLFARGSICESLLMIEPAIAAFTGALDLRPSDPAARKNLELCRSIKASRHGAESPESRYALHKVMLEEGRLPQALRMAERLPDDLQLLHLTWSAILEAAGLRSQLVLNPEGTFDLSLTAQSQVDLSLLTGLPLRRLDLARSGITDLSPLHGSRLRELDLSGNPVRDLAPLSGVPLESLNLSNTEVTMLFPLSGMPLRELVLDHSPVSDLSPLRGSHLETLRAAGTTVWNLQPLSESPLKSLDLAHTRVSDLTPLRHLSLSELNLDGTEVTDLAPLEGMALSSLNLSRTGVRSLEPLRKAPLQELWLGGCLRLDGIEPLAGQTSLEKLTLPPQCKKLSLLRGLPSLRFLAYDGEGQQVAVLTTAPEFWRSQGEK